MGGLTETQRAGGQLEAVEVGDRDWPACVLGPTAAIGREGRRNRLLQRAISAPTYRWIKQSKHEYSHPAQGSCAPGSYWSSPLCCALSGLGAEITEIH